MDMKVVTTTKRRKWTKRTRDSSNWKPTKTTTSLHSPLSFRFQSLLLHSVYISYIVVCFAPPLLWLGEGGSEWKWDEKQWMGEEKRKCHLWGGRRQLAERQWWRSARESESERMSGCRKNRRNFLLKFSLFVHINFKISWYVEQQHQQPFPRDM